MSGPDDLERLVERARAGERAALDAVIDAIRDPVYNLAIRMLWHPEDAEDATQEILIRVITKLDRFRGESAFRTWVYRIAANHLLTVRKRRAERDALSFDAFAEDLADGLSDGRIRSTHADADERLLIEEVKIACSQAMLLCLDRPYRLAYILGEVLGLGHREAAAVLDITPSAFRQRLSRARKRLYGFLRRHCGLVHEAAPCRCRRRVDRAVALGRVSPARLLFASHLRADPDVMANWRAVEEIREEAAVFRAHPSYAAPERIVGALRALLDAKAH